MKEMKNIREILMPSDLYIRYLEPDTCTEGICSSTLSRQIIYLVNVPARDQDNMNNIPGQFKHICCASGKC